ncbi:MAG: hypothetical protein C0506_01810 [Anaerolinea sp.]|nr:hypothetical protein [Anaerolinea sp.]
MEQLDDSAKRPTRRGSRGGRGRGRANGTEAAAAEIVEEASAPLEAPAAPARAPRRSARAKPAETVDEPAAVAEPAAPATATRPRPRRGTPRQQAEMKAREEAAPAEQPGPGPSATGPRGRGPQTGTPDNALARAIEQQGRQIEQLAETVRRAGSGGAVGASGTRARVGVFVDAANVELASDRMRARFDWAKILDMLTHDRQLVRAIAYSPVHDDPGVSIETQRFVEPFLGKGYKVVTKPLKRFQDGTIKANVDIELALDIMEMLDRLDVVCLVSGDGDFQRLVEVVQSKGVRVEVVAVGNSTAGNLRNAADQFIDLQQRLREVRI